MIWMGSPGPSLLPSNWAGGEGGNYSAEYCRKEFVLMFRIIKFLLHVFVQALYWKILLNSARLLGIWISAVNEQLVFTEMQHKHWGSFGLFPLLGF